MDGLQQFEIYIEAQKNVAIQFILIGVVLIVTALLLHLWGKGELSAGLRIGALVCGCLILVGGIVYRNTEANLLKSTTDQKSPAEFKQQETERMEKVVRDYPVYQFVFGGFIILSLLIVCFVKAPFWHGVAFSVISLFVLVMIAEAYSHQSIKTYFENLTA